MQKPLEPIDGLASVMRARSHAIAELGDGAGAQVHRRKVQTPLVHRRPGALVAPGLIKQERRREGGAVLGQAQAVLQSACLASLCEVRIGRSGDGMAARAAERGCDAVPLDTPGTGAAAGLLLGAVATRLLPAAQLPATRVK